MAHRRNNETVRHLTMWEVMGLPSLQGATVIAGADGLGRVVVNAMVMEGPDVDRWAKPGLVLVTSFFALEPLTWERRLAFFQQINEIGIAGIIYKPGRLESDSIDSYLAICDELSIPVVQMDPTVNFEAVLMDIMGHAIDSNALLLGIFYDVHRQIIKLALQSPNIRTIVQRLSTTLECEVTYCDRAENLSVGTDPVRAEFQQIDLKELRYQQYQSYHYHNAVISREGQPDEDALAVLIPRQTVGTAYLIIHKNPAEVSALSRMVIENYASLLVLELLKQDAIEERSFSRNNMVVHDLLQNRYASHEEIDAAVKELNIDTHKLYQALLLRISFTDPSNADRSHDIFTLFHRKLKRVYARSVYYEASNRITFLRNHTATAAGFDPATVVQILEEIKADPSLPDFTYLLAVSEHRDRYNIGELNNEVMGIYRLFDSDRLANRFIDYGELGIYKLLIETGDLSLVADYIDPRIARLRSENPEGFSTVVTLCECGLSYGKAAKELFVHPKTVHYRVERVRDLYGIDAHDPNDIVQIMLSAKLSLLLGDV